MAGRLGEPVIVTDFLDIPGKPDGMVMARDGSFWVAMWGARHVVQVAPNGAIIRRINLPAPQVGSLCMDPSGDLYVSTARVRMSGAALEKDPGAGGLFRISLSTQIAV